MSGGGGLHTDGASPDFHWESQCIAEYSKASASAHGPRQGHINSHYQHQHPLAPCPTAPPRPSYSAPPLLPISAPSSPPLSQHPRTVHMYSTDVTPRALLRQQIDRFVEHTHHTQTGQRERARARARDRAREIERGMAGRVGSGGGEKERRIFVVPTATHKYTHTCTTEDHTMRHHPRGQFSPSTFSATSSNTRPPSPLSPTSQPAFVGNPQSTWEQWKRWAFRCFQPLHR